MLFLNKAKPKERKGKIFLLNASQRVRQGRPEELHPRRTLSCASPTLSTRGRKRRNISRIVSREEIAKNDFNISPSRYIHTGVADEYRPIAEIVEELDALEEEAKDTNNQLKEILKIISV